LLFGSPFWERKRVGVSGPVPVDTTIETTASRIGIRNRLRHEWVDLDYSDIDGTIGPARRCDTSARVNRLAVQWHGHDAATAAKIEANVIIETDEWALTPS
jgi:hypothetical protein